MRQDDPPGRGEEDWLGDDRWLDAPTEEGVPTERPRRQAWQRRPVGAWNRNRVATAAVLAVAVLVVIGVIAASALRDDESGEVSDPAQPPPPTQADTRTAEQAPALPENARLELGDRGRQVRALQRALSELGYEAGEPDGVFGSQTLAALRRFQGDAGLPEDGIAGPNTLRALNRALAERS